MRAWGNYRILYLKTNKEASTVLCSVVKHLGSGRALKKWGKPSTASRVFPYTSFMLYRFLRALQHNRAQSRLLYLLNVRWNKVNVFTGSVVQWLCVCAKNICTFSLPSFAKQQSNMVKFHIRTISQFFIFVWNSVDHCFDIFYWSYILVFNSHRCISIKQSYIIARFLNKISKYIFNQVFKQSYLFIIITDPQWNWCTPVAVPWYIPIVCIFKPVVETFFLYKFWNPIKI